MLILVINCGSSSAKYQLFDVATSSFLAKGIVERIGQARAELRHQIDGGDVYTRTVACKNHYVAISIIVDALTDSRYGVISSKLAIRGVGHRVVHGGEEFKSSTLITPKVIRSIEKCSDLAPLHNPPSSFGIKACLKILKGISQVAVFDTSFHQTMPTKAYLYGLPISYYKKYGIRRYGFHGTSHRFVAEEASRRIGRPLKDLKLITCHLGNGCSITAVDGGKSVDTSMGFTPLEGLIMGTRSGDIDPALIAYLAERKRLTASEVTDILNKKSGLLGLTGVSNDMRDILACSRAKGVKSEQCKIALDIFVYRIKKYIGAYLAAMGGLDAVVFTAGIGENSPWLVKSIENDLKGIVPRGTRFMVVPTNEELLIARDTYEIIKRGKAQGANKIIFDPGPLPVGRQA